MEIYKEVGYDGKTKEFVHGGHYYNKIYKQYRRTRAEWIKAFVNALEKSKYNKEEQVEIINHCLLNKYYVSEQFYVKPSILVQRLNELGYANLDIL